MLSESQRKLQKIVWDEESKRAKLQHEDLNMNQLRSMKISDIDRALKYCNDIQSTNKDLQSFFYYLQKGDKTNIENLIKKWNNR